MRPNNILITHDHEALLGDFGLAKTQREDSEKSTETTVVGTLGYLNPEYAESGKVSTKTDVYAFGVVLLQLITGRSTTDKKLEGQSLVGWVSLYTGKTTTKRELPPLSRPQNNGLTRFLPTDLDGSSGTKMSHQGS
nr:proline-rich receptor-like protein kinase perk8 [Quercus suber]